MGQPKMRKLLTYFTFKSFQKAFSSAFCGLFWAMAPGYVVCFFCWLLSAAIQFCILMADDRSRHLKCIFRCLLSMTFLGWGISMPWLRWCCAQAQMKYSDLLLMAILHYGGPLNMTITNTVIVYFFSRQQAEDEESRHQEAMMQFQSVRSAQCSCPHDEQRIRLAIEGSEEEVDKVIGILVKAGAYTDQLREAYEMGSWFRFEIHVFHTCFIRVSCVSNFNPSLPQMMIPMDFQHVTFMGPCVFNMFSTCFFSVPGNDMQGAGYTNLLSSSVVAMLGWTFVAADSVSYALLVQKMELSRVWLRDGFLVLATICCWDGSIYIYTHGVCVCVFMVASVGFMASGGFSCDPMIIPIIHLNHILSRFPEAFEAEVVLQSARCFCRCFGPIVMDLIELFLWSEVGPPAPSGLRVFKVGGFSKVFTTFKWGLHMS